MTKIEPCPRGRAIACRRHDHAAPGEGRQKNGIARDKMLRDHRDEVLFIDACALGHSSAANLSGKQGPSQFEGVALRYQQSNNGGGSDKLFSATSDVSPVSLPAAGLLLLGALGGSGVAARRHKVI